MNSRKKRFVLHSIAAAMALTLVACGGGGDDNDKPGPGPGSEPGPGPGSEPGPDPKPPVATTLERVQARYDRATALWATSTPSAEQSFADYDGCYLNNGQSKDQRIASFSPAAAAYLLGFKVENLEIVDERQTTNSDGSARHEVDVQYDEVYADGTTAKAVRATLISGSSAGTADCAAPTVSDDMRVLGNQRIAGFAMNPRNFTTWRNKLSDGSAVGTANSIRREVRVSVTDPAKRATYAIVSGPGFASGKWKMLASHVARDAPEMQGKPGNANYQDSDNFRICNAPPGTPYSAEAADCTGQGVGGDAAGVSVGDALDSAAIEAEDNRFNSWGFSTTERYTVELYNDDGWKTVGGQAGKTPIATYTARLSALPYTLAQMAANLATISPGVGGSSLLPHEVAEAMRDGGGTTTLTVRQPQPLAGEPPLATSSVSAYVHGPQTGAMGQWPRVRATSLAYPTPGAGDTFSVTIPAKPEQASAVTYGELWLNGSNRNGRVVAYQLQFFD